MAQKMVQEDETLSEVNVIPLADLSLVLLIILMVLSPMITQALIQVSASKAAVAQTQEEMATPETPVIVSFEPGVLKLAAPGAARRAYTTLRIPHSVAERVLGAPIPCGGAG